MSTMLIFSGCGKANTNQDTLNKDTYIPSNSEVNLPQASESESNETINDVTTETINVEVSDEELLKIHYLDVGQANCTLVQYGDIEFLIDGGNVDDGDDIVNYINALGIDDIEYVVATHPHEDHIGGLPTIMSAFTIDNVYTPYIEDEYIPTTAIYNKFESVIDNKGINEIHPNNEDVIFSNNDIEFSVIFDGRVKSSDLNDYSIITKLEYKNTSYSFTGDSTSGSEDLIMDYYKDDLSALKSDVLLVGHHGSSTSTTNKFLKAVSPIYAIISCEKGNSYGHPHVETLQKLKGIDTYRTDVEGTIVIVSDGKEYNVYKKCTGDYHLGSSNYNNTMNLPEKYFSNVNIIESTPNQETSETSNEDSDVSEANYIGNVNSKKVHVPTCSSLPSEKNSAYFETLDEALSQGYSKCGNCMK